MLSLRLLRLFSVRSTCNQAPILQESYKVYKETGLRSLSTGSVKMSSRGKQGAIVSYQNVVVMRHGERFDNFEPSWAATAARPWDPPLAEAGRKRAFKTGLRLRESVEFPIGRVFVSPFLRCLQTAVELVASLSDGVAVKPSEVKVSVEYGLCEMMNSKAIRPNVAPKDGNMGFDVAVCEAMLPAEIVDKNVERMCKELPQWEESVLQAGARYQQLIKDLADKYPTENLLLVTHGEGVKVAVSSFKKDAEVNEVDYCGYVELRRPMFMKDHTFAAGEFDLLTTSGQTGVSYFLPRPLGSDTNQTLP
ncbi:uncharacterized protein LOC114412812 isoform X3 [Glycine soja]|uniref:uncharacterized protein isoform X3 n=1 Tax=Glycine max TaxID=3847 RepID=UPI0003DEB32A|nr:uncharacterized protein LOC100780830 isoform X3 [Glycine max]XP_028232692.1 uncharacterized protein LOC114412812 isoform X3 [Glycine soja]|eukprot:XP_006606963.1 uncharacterized protein LOC100780830 isoform X3 [Glycine max]